MDNEVSQGVYTNFTISNFSSEEFILDFAYLQPQQPKGKIRSRVIMSPKNAKRLAALLTQNISNYEKKYGLISDAPHLSGIQMNFNNLSIEKKTILEVDMCEPDSLRFSTL